MAEAIPAFLLLEHAVIKESYLNVSLSEITNYRVYLIIV
jgi:hypothetical protein